MMERFQEFEPIEEEILQPERTLEELMQVERLYEDVEKVAEANKVAEVTLTEEEEKRQRVMCVLNEVFAGNQSRMGGEIGVAPSLLNKVAKGVQPATDELMRRIASIPGLNQLWVLSGEGMMFQNPIATLPVSEKFLVGKPKEWKSDLTGNRFGVPSDFARDTCYYYKVGPDSDLLKYPGGEYKVGDLLLIETDQSVIFKFKWDSSKHFIFTIKQLNNRSNFVCGKIEAHQKDQIYLVQNQVVARLVSENEEFFKSLEKKRRIVRIPRPEDEEEILGKPILQEQSKPSIKDNETPKAKPLNEEKKPDELPTFTWCDAIGIRLMLLRT